MDKKSEQAMRERERKRAPVGVYRKAVCVHSGTKIFFLVWVSLAEQTDVPLGPKGCRL